MGLQQVELGDGGRGKLQDKFEVESTHFVGGAVGGFSIVAKTTANCFRGHSLTICYGRFQQRRAL